MSQAKIEKNEVKAEQFEVELTHSAEYETHAQLSDMAKHAK